MALDGPEGPHHEPKKFVLLTALLSKRRMITVTFDFKWRIILKKRWDRYLIPLPFSRVDVKFCGPFDVEKGEFEELSARIVEAMP